VGGFSDNNNVVHGYERTADGRFIVIDAPDAGTGPFQGTAATINDASGRIAEQRTGVERAQSAFFLLCLEAGRRHPNPAGGATRGHRPKKPGTKTTQ
jgi:hypothetical protein